MIQVIVAISRLGNGGILALMAVPLVFLSVAAPFNARTPSPQDLSQSALLSSPPRPLTSAITLKLVTFNVKDLMIVASDRPARMRAIGQVLVELDPDIVGIQEGFIEKDRQVLFKTIEGSRLRYHRYFPSATVGSGLLTLSAFPILEGFFHRYTRSGPWHRLDEGDWWAGKGVSLARVELPDAAGYVDFYNTHAQADYGNKAYIPLRENQMRELAAFIKRSVTGTSPAFLVGDINCRPRSPEFTAAVEEAGLVRLMAIESRIDHIFGVGNPRYAFEVLDTSPIRGTVPVARGATELSDHTGYLSTIRIVPVPQG